LLLPRLPTPPSKDQLPLLPGDDSGDAGK
jgi:hypothetical protein